MKNYYIYIKSHDENSDYEDYCEATNRKEATNLFLKRGLGQAGWEYPEVYERTKKGRDYI